MRKIVICFFLLSLSMFYISQTEKFESSYNLKRIFFKIKEKGRLREVEQRSEKLVKIGDYFYSKIESLKGDQPMSLFSNLNADDKRYEMNLMNKFEDFKELLASKKGMSSSESEKNYMVSFQEIWKELRTDSFDLNVNSSRIKLIGGRGEWESHQMVVTPFKYGIDSLNITLLNFPYHNENIEFYWGEYVKCNRSAYKRKGSNVQDVLIPMNKKNDSVYINCFYPTFVDKYTSKSIYLNLYIDKNIVPGNYNFNIRISAFSNGKRLEEYKVPVDVNVAQFKYDKRYALKMLNSYNYDWTNWYYKDSSFVDSILPSHSSFLIKNHLSLAHLYPKPEETKPDVSEWLNLYNQGGNAFVLYNIGSETYHKLHDSEFQKRFIEKIKSQESYLEEIGLLESTYIYLFDELNKEKKHQLDFVTKLLKSNGVKSKLLTTSTFVPSKKLIDAWCPVIQEFDENKVHFENDQDTIFKEKWTYLCNTTKSDLFGNVFIDESHLNPRKIFWNVYEKGVSHFLYYSINRWDKNLTYDSNKASINRLLNMKTRTINWNSASYTNHNGDGQLVYPGVNGELWPSPRFFSYRDGIEDHQLFFQSNVQKDKIRSLSSKEVLKLRNDLLEK